MTRKEHLKITTFHEIGHYLLIEKFNKLYPQHFIGVYQIKLYFEENTPHFGDVIFFKEALDVNDASDDMIEAFICIDLAGFVAPTLFFNISYDKEAIKELDDFKSAYYNASVLSERYLKYGINKSPNEIFNEKWKETKNYLEEHKDVLHDLGIMLYKKQVLSVEDLQDIKKNYKI